MDIRQSNLWSAYMAKLGWETVSIGNTNVYTKKLPFGFHLAKIPRSRIPLDYGLIDKELKKRKTLFVKIEPDTQNISNEEVVTELEKHGYKKDSWILLPSKTIKIDLTRPLEEIIQSFSKNTRYTLKTAQKNEIRIEESENIGLFNKMLKNTAQRKRISSTTKEARLLYEVTPENRLLLFATINGKPLSATLFTWYKDIAYYSFAATTPEGNKAGAPTLIIVRAIEILKEKGIKTLNFEGIEDKRYKTTKSWSGFTHFKQGFNGNIVEYPPSMIKHYSIWTRILFSIMPW